MESSQYLPIGIAIILLIMIARGNNSKQIIYIPFLTAETSGQSTSVISPTAVFNPSGAVDIPQPVPSVYPVDMNDRVLAPQIIASSPPSTSTPFSYTLQIPKHAQVAFMDMTQQDVDVAFVSYQKQPLLLTGASKLYYDHSVRALPGHVYPTRCTSNILNYSTKSSNTPALGDVGLDYTAWKNQMDPSSSQPNFDFVEVLPANTSPLLVGLWKTTSDATSYEMLMPPSTWRIGLEFRFMTVQMLVARYPVYYSDVNIVSGNTFRSGYVPFSSSTMPSYVRSPETLSTSSGVNPYKDTELTTSYYNDKQIVAGKTLIIAVPDTNDYPTDVLVLPASAVGTSTSKTPQAPYPYSTSIALDSEIMPHEFNDVVPHEFQNVYNLNLVMADQSPTKQFLPTIPDTDNSTITDRVLLSGNYQSTVTSLGGCIIAMVFCSMFAAAAVSSSGNTVKMLKSAFTDSMNSSLKKYQGIFKGMDLSDMLMIATSGYVLFQGLTFASSSLAMIALVPFVCAYVGAVLSGLSSAKLNRIDGSVSQQALGGLIGCAVVYSLTDLLPSMYRNAMLLCMFIGGGYAISRMQT